MVQGDRSSNSRQRGVFLHYVLSFFFLSLFHIKNKPTHIFIDVQGFKPKSQAKYWKYFKRLDTQLGNLLKVYQIIQLASFQSGVTRHNYFHTVFVPSFWARSGVCQT